MYVLSKEELEKLQQESAVARLKKSLTEVIMVKGANCSKCSAPATPERPLFKNGDSWLCPDHFQKSVKMAGTARPMPILPQRAPPTVMNQWEMEEGRKHDEEQARLKEERRLADSQPAPVQRPQPQRTSSTTYTVRRDEFATPGQNPQWGGQIQSEEGGPENPVPTFPTTQAPYGSQSQTEETANPSMVKDDSEELPPGHSTEDHVAALAENPETRRAMQEYFSAFQRKKEEAEARIKSDNVPADAAGSIPTDLGEEIPPADEGAVPGHYVPVNDGSHSTRFQEYDALDIATNANQTPPGKLAASPGRSGSSGIFTAPVPWRLNSGQPDLEKSFTKMNRTVSTYCRDCGVAVDEEGGDEVHFRKSGGKCSHFRKI